MLRITILIFLSISSNIGVGQVLVQARILDSLSHESLPFSNIGVMGSSKGTTSDLDGSFSINISKDDTILISYVGYYNRLLTTYMIDSIIYMSPKKIILDEVVIHSSNSNSIKQKLGNNKSKTYVLKGGANQYAMFLKNPKHQIGYFEKLYYDIKPALKDERWESLIRIRIYKNDNGFPGDDILKKSIEYRISKKANIIIANIKNYNALFPVEGCFIGFDLIGFYDESGKYVPYAPENIPINTHIEFSSDNLTNKTYSKFFGTNWMPTTFKSRSKNSINIAAKFSAKVLFYK